jgi:hypothetical protein
MASARLLGAQADTALPAQFVARPPPHGRAVRERSVVRNAAAMQAFWRHGIRAL